MRNPTTGRVVGSGIAYDDYSENAYPSNRTKVHDANYGCNLPNEKEYQWDMLTSKCITIVPAFIK
jgi:hypothetical protein